MDHTAHSPSDFRSDAASHQSPLPDWVKFGVPIVVLLLVGSVVKIAYDLREERENATEMSAAYERRNSELSQDLDATRNQVSDLDQKTITLTAELDTSRKEIEGLTGDVATLEGKVATMTTSLEEAAVREKNLSGMVASLEGQVNDLGALKARLENDLAARTTELSDVTAQRETLTSELDAARKANKSLTEADLAKAERLKMLEGRITEIEMALANEKTTLATIETERNRLAEDKRRMTTQLEQLKAESDELSTKLAAYVESAEAQKAAMATLTKERDELSSSRDMLATQIRDLSEKLSATTGQRDAAMAERDSLKAEMVQLQQQLDDLQKQSESQQESISSLAAERDDLKVQLEASALRQTEGQERILEKTEGIESDISAIQEANDRITRAFEEINGRALQLNEQLRRMEEQFEAATDRNQALNDTVESLQRRLETADGAGYQASAFEPYLP